MVLLGPALYRGLMHLLQTGELDISLFNPVAYYDSLAKTELAIAVIGVLMSVVVLTVFFRDRFGSLLLSVFLAWTVTYVLGQGLPNIREALASKYPQLSPVASDPLVFYFVTLVPLLLCTWVKKLISGGE